MVFNNITMIVIVAMIFTNGLTDATNAIATIVGSKVMSFRKAAIISAICDFCGVIVMSFVSISVADCISSMVNLNSGSEGLVVLISAMASVIVFALIALCFGIPTSETHGLIAGLTGSAIALYSSNAVNWHDWINVIIGLAWSVAGGIGMGYLFTKLLKKKLKKIPDEKISKFQIFGMCAMSFMHGAQDGQKFIGILVIYYYIIKGMQVPDTIVPYQHLILILFVATIMFIGVSIGGKKIVENVGKNMTRLTKKQALCTDISTSVTLFLASLNGIPVSTTHVKTLSIVGVGRAAKHKISKKIIYEIVKAWLLTFPVCFGLAYIIAKILIKLI